MPYKILLIFILMFNIESNFNLTSNIKRLYNKTSQFFESTLNFFKNNNFNTIKSKFSSLSSLLHRSAADSFIQNQPEKILGLRPLVSKDQYELRKLLQNQKNLPSLVTITSLYKKLLRKKFESLTDKHDYYISLISNKSKQEINTMKNTYDFSLALKNNFQKEITDPIKAYAKQGIYLTDLLIPLNDNQKQLLIKNGLDAQYSDWIYMINRDNIDPTIESLIQYNRSQYLYRGIPNNQGGFRTDTPLILIEKINFEEKALAPLIFILNHEIQHHNHSKQLFQYRFFEELLKHKNPNILCFMEKYMELEADILGILNTPIDHAIDALQAINHFTPDMLTKIHNKLWVLTSNPNKGMLETCINTVKSHNIKLKKF